ncbi:hypothetical protein BpHYR1_015570 [Brachionus plicatilis]|uniref:Uncharacterized protein n=1 Tax=Brachionus plicatilis TaxID=10195 RepID=A0A3M7S5K9_BRAPC|nr:hypothetical protein BpHYR1_015570 [Brachionus plicatilis]
MTQTRKFLIMKKISIYIGIIVFSLALLTSECKDPKSLKKRAITEWRFRRVNSNQMDSENVVDYPKSDKHLQHTFMFKNLPIYNKLYGENIDYPFLFSIICLAHNMLIVIYPFGHLYEQAIMWQQIF